MASCFYCPAYEDVKAKLSLADGVVYVSLNVGKDDLHLTISQTQALVLGEALQHSGSRISIGDVAQHALFGNLEVEFNIAQHEQKLLEDDAEVSAEIYNVPAAERPVA